MQCFRYVWAFLLLCACCVGVGGSVAFAETREERVATLQIENRAELSKSDVQYLSDLVQQAALHLPREHFSVMTKDNVQVMLPPGTRLEECIDECAVQTARNLQAHWLVTGIVSRFAGELKVVLKLYETKTGQPRGSMTAGAKELKGLDGPLMVAAVKLFGVLEPSMLDVAERLTGGIVFKKFQVAVLPDVLEVESFKEKKSGGGKVDFGDVDVAVLEKYEAAVVADMPNTSVSVRHRIELWGELREQKGQMGDIARARLVELESFEKMRQDVLKQLRDIKQADAQVEKARKLQMKGDWIELSRRLSLTKTLSEENKMRWVEAFLESYGAVDGLNPHLKDRKLSEYIKKLGDKLKYLQLEGARELERRNRRADEVNGRICELVPEERMCVRRAQQRLRHEEAERLRLQKDRERREREERERALGKVDFGSVDVAVLEKYELALKSDKPDSSMSVTERIALWRSLSDASGEIGEIARRRLNDLETAEQIRQIELKRIRNMIHVEAIFDRDRKIQMDKDWDSLSRLLPLTVVSYGDKLRWVEAFLESYGAVERLNPYVKDQRIVEFIKKLGNKIDQIRIAGARELDRKRMESKERINRLCELSPDDDICRQIAEERLKRALQEEKEKEAEKAELLRLTLEKSMLVKKQKEEAIYLEYVKSEDRSKKLKYAGKAALWISFASAIIGAGGYILSEVALSNYSDTKGRRDLYDENFENFEIGSKTAYVSFTVAGVLSFSGVILLLASSSSKKSDPRLSASITPTEGGAVTSVLWSW